MAERKLRPPAEEPIKHTAGGEMPDAGAVSRHRFHERDFQDIGQDTGPSARHDARKVPLPMLLLYACGFVTSLYFLLRASKRRIEKSRFKEEGDTFTEKERQTMEADSSPSARRLGA